MAVAVAVGLRDGRFDREPEPTCPVPRVGADPLWDHTAVSWLTALGICAALAVAMVIVLAVRLSRFDPRRKARN